MSLNLPAYKNNSFNTNKRLTKRLINTMYHKPNFQKLRLQGLQRREYRYEKG